MIEHSGSGLIIKGSDTSLHIHFYTGNVVRFTYCPGRTTPAPTPVVVAKAQDLTVKVDGNKITTPLLSIEVLSETLALLIKDRSGSVLSEDRAVIPAEPRVVKKRLWEKSIYGNGERYGWLDQIGSRLVNYNRDVLFHEPIQHSQGGPMYKAVPFYIGAAPGRAYGIYFDNPYRTVFDFAKSDPVSFSFQADDGILDYYFLPGLTVADVVENFARLTGTPPLPRKIFLGYQQSRYSYESRQELLSVAENLRRHKVPCDVLYLDIHHLDAYKVFTVDRERFSGFREMLKSLKEMGFSVVVIVNPGVKVENGYRVYEEGLHRGYFVTTPGGDLYRGEVWPGQAVFPDFLRSEVRQWWGAFHRELLACGVEGIWNDMNEPSDFSSREGTLPPQSLHVDDSGISRPHSGIHNLYGLLQTASTREALERYSPDKRPFVLTRSSFAGGQRYAAVWTGDNSSTWEHLECSIPMNLNLGLSGFSFTGSDVGGYRGDCGAELMIRWTQLGCFIPFFRNHSEYGSARQEPWAYDEETMAIINRYIRLRYRLLTYLYCLLHESYLTGAPAMRPLVYHYGDDPAVYHIYDQFLLGRGLMVCPVTRPGAEQRMVYLPRGLWHDYWTGEVLGGGQYLVCAAPLDRIPLFVAAGAILPHDAPFRDPDFSASPACEDEPKGPRQPAKPLIINCYRGASGFYRFYTDDGISPGYREGLYSEATLSFNDQAVNPELKIEITKNGYPLPAMEAAFIPARRPG